MRRLPVYLLLDTSGSMSGEPIESVRNGVQVLHSTLRKDPYALESAYISVITFDSDVKQIVPLTEVSLFQPPTIQSSGGTSLGGVLKKVSECADSEVKKSTENEKGDWRPLVFLMTDGYPTDDLQKGLVEFKKRKWGIVVVCGTDDADFDALRQITENVVKLSQSDSASIGAFFKWVSASIATSSKKVDSGAETSDAMSELPPPPPEIILV